MVEESTKKEINEEKELRLYELGYHVLPLIEEGAVLEKATFLRDQTEKHKGIIIGDQAPHMIALAYPIQKVVNKKRRYFETAYFGWIKFRMTSDGALALEKSLKHNEDILRFILIKTAEEEIVPLKKMHFMKDMAVDHQAPTLGEEKKGKVLSEEELEKTVEELVVE